MIVQHYSNYSRKLFICQKQKYEFAQNSIARVGYIRSTASTGPTTVKGIRPNYITEAITKCSYRYFVTCTTFQTPYNNILCF